VKTVSAGDRTPPASRAEQPLCFNVVGLVLPVVMPRAPLMEFVRILIVLWPFRDALVRNVSNSGSMAPAICESSLGNLEGKNARFVTPPDLVELVEWADKILSE
jgi:hypothetical protein